ncbi:MAG: elongation factor 1-alpha C-terminal domain-related protein, partial [Motilibacteraceae bacterium]
VPHVVLVVNKMDLVGWDRSAFEQVAAQFQAWATALGLSGVPAVPVSALHGDNVVAPAPDLAWYDGPTLLELLESIDLEVPADAGARGFRFPVQYVVRAPERDFRGYAGRVAGGSVRPGDAVVVLPSGIRTSVAAVETYDGPLESADEGRSVVLRLSDDVDVARGDLLAAAADAPEPTQDVEGTVCWLDERPLRPGARALLRHGTRTVRAVVREVVDRLDVDTLQRVPAADGLSLNEIGHVRVRTQEPLPIDEYARVRSTGAFLLVDDSDGATLAAGMATASPSGR